MVGTLEPSPIPSGFSLLFQSKSFMLNPDASTRSSDGTLTLNRCPVKAVGAKNASGQTIRPSRHNEKEMRCEDGTRYLQGRDHNMNVDGCGQTLKSFSMIRCRERCAKTRALKKRTDETSNILHLKLPQSQQTGCTVESVHGV